MRRYRDEAAARTAIEDREVYGAFVATSSGPEVLTASAASPVVAQLLTHAAAAGGGSAQPAAAVPVEDVKAASPSGSALGSSVLPLVLAGILTGLMGVSLAVGRPAPDRADRGRVRAGRPCCHGGRSRLA